MILELENTVTKQKSSYVVSDTGNKLYYKFDISLSGQPDGE